MDWQQKWLALKVLSPWDAALTTDIHGQWYVDLKGVEIGDGKFLETFGCHRDTPQEAIEATFTRLTTLDLEHFVAVRHSTDPPRRRNLRWTGFMWDDYMVPAVPADQAVAER